MSKYNVAVEMEFISDQFKQGCDQANKAIEKLEKKEKDLQKESDMLSGSLKREATAIRNIGNAADHTGKKVGLMGRMFGSLRGQLLGMTAGLTGVFTIKKIVGDLGDLTIMLSKIQTNTHATNAEMEQLKDTMIKLAPSTMFNVGDLMHTAFMRSKTDTVAKIKADMAIIAQLAMVTPEKSLEMASNTVSTIQNIFKDRSTVEIANAVMRATDGAKMSIMEYAEAFKTAGIAGKSYGKNMEEVNAMIATLSAGGVTGSVAGTAILKFLSSLSQLQRASKDQKRLMRALGISFKDINPSVNKTSDIIEKLSSKLGKLNDTTKSQALRMLFGSGQGSEFIKNLLNKAEFQKNLEQQFNIKMTVEKGAASQMAVLGGQIKGLGSDLLGLVYAFEPLTPLLLELVKILRMLTKSIGYIIRPIASLVGGLGTDIQVGRSTKAENLTSSAMLLQEMKQAKPKGFWDMFNRMSEISDNDVYMNPNINVPNTNSMLEKPTLQKDNKITVVLESKTPNVAATVVNNTVGTNLNVQKRNFLN